jgi:hypothetical protein
MRKTAQHIPEQHRIEHDPTPASFRTPHAVAADLAEPLAALIDRYEAFVKSLEAHRAAISQADGRGIDAAIARETELLEELLRLDETCRRALGQTTTTHNNASERAPMQGGWTLTRLAAALGGDEGQRIAESSAYLKALTSRADILQKSVREASHAMASHIDGLVRQVAQRLSHTGTYGAAGRVETKPQVVSGLDMSL